VQNALSFMPYHHLLFHHHFPTISSMHTTQKKSTSSTPSNDESGGEGIGQSKVSPPPSLMITQGRKMLCVDDEKPLLFHWVNQMDPFIWMPLLPNALPF